MFKDVDLILPNDYDLADVAAALVIAGYDNADPVSVYTQLKAQDDANDR